MKSEDEIRAHLKHLKEQYGKWDPDIETRTNLGIGSLIDGGITAIEWVLEISDVKVA